MADRDAFLRTIDEGYAQRMAGNKDAMRRIFAPDAQFRIAGDPTLIPGVAASAGSAAPTVEALMDDFEFHDMERLDTIVEGDKAAVYSRVTLSYRGGHKVTTELYDLWTIDQDGRVTSMLQFADTALVARLTA